MDGLWCHTFWMCSLLLWGFQEAAFHGREFVTTFLQNKNSNELPNWDIVVTGTSEEPSTTVTVTAMRYNLTKAVTVGKGETAKIPIPVYAEFKGTGIFSNPVVVKASADITAMSRNYKKNSGDVTLIHPVKSLGTEYIVSTPSGGPANEYKEFSIISLEKITPVGIYLKSSLHFTAGPRPRRSVRAEKLEIVLKPYETFQIQSKDDLSGTRVVSDFPVVVLAGHTCANSNIGCGHVYEQLNCVEGLGTSYAVPGMPFQPDHDTVLVTSPTVTTIKYQSGDKKGERRLSAGRQIQFSVNMSSPLFIESRDKIQVLLLGGGGTFQGTPFGPFLTRVPSSDTFCRSFSLNSQDDFDNNYAIITSKTSEDPAISISGVNKEFPEWKAFPQTKYAWTGYNFGRVSGAHSIQQTSSMSFGVLSIGYSKNKAYGSMAPCI